MRPKKIAIVSVLIGSYDTKIFEIPEYNHYKYDFIMYTNMTKLKSDSWQIRHIDKLEIPNNISKSAYYYKWNLHNILDTEKYDYVVWMDASVQKFDINRFDQFVNAFVESGNALWIEKHPTSHSLRQEMDLNCRLLKDNHDKMVNQVNRYYAEGFKDVPTTCVETGFTCRILKDEKLNRLCDILWNEMKPETATKRDQLIYDYALWKSGLTNFKQFTLAQKHEIVMFTDHPHRPEHKPKVLLVGPWFGEQEQEKQWSVYVQKHIESVPYDEVIVGCRPGREELYEYADRFLISDPIGEKNKNLLNNRVPFFDVKTKGDKEIIQLNPKNSICDNFKMFDRSESKIHLLWCTIRPKMFVDTYEEWLSNCDNIDNIKTTIAVDTEEQKKELENYLTDENIVVTNSKRQGVTYPSYLLSSKLAFDKDISDEDIVVFASDDFFPMKDWDKALIEEFETYEGALLVNDKYGDPKHKRSILSIPIMTVKTLRRLNGVIYHPDYIHCWSDNELYDNLVEMDLLKDIYQSKPNLYFQHKHFSNGGRELDDIDKHHQMTNSEDMERYKIRRKLPLQKRLEAKRVISFSLWGDDPKYTLGAIENAKLRKSIYPDWLCRFYYDKTVPQDIIDRLASEGSEMVLKETSDGYSGMAWRFEVGFDSTVDRFIIRDTDSRINLKERYAVEEWIKSDKTFHVMRDHANHGVPILGGMWGGVKGFISNFENLYETWVKSMAVTNHTRDKYFNYDQIFLWQNVWPLVKHNTMAHDEIFRFTDEEKPFSFNLDDGLFIGQSYDENNKPIFEY